jgi:hypothetical protein
VTGLRTGWRDSIPVRYTCISLPPRPDMPWSPPRFLWNVYRVLLCWGKVTGLLWVTFSCCQCLDCIPSIDGMTDEMERIWVEVVVTYWRYYPGSCVEGSQTSCSKLQRSTFRSKSRALQLCTTLRIECRGQECLRLYLPPPLIRLRA